MGVNDTWGEVVRGSVKMVFVLCYIAFMWASIHHVAVYFNNFEQGNGDMFGSYALAGAFDITALVTTIGVMFFRKSMPLWVLWIVWIFILAIAAYSFFINWEYASHYQNMDLIMQPTGATTPVYDQQGVLHYVPAMRANTGLLWINPILASGFTIFSLIYSIIAEFFGTKPPTAEELLAKKAYLEETSSLLSEIQKLEGQKSKHPSWVQRAKGLAQEVKDGAQEIVGEKKQKKDPQMMKLEKVVSFYRNTPHLLTEEEHVPSTELMIKDMLKLRKVEQAHAWRVQAAEMLRLEQAKVTVQEPVTTVETEEEAELEFPVSPAHVGEDKLQLTLDFLAVNPGATDEELARHLELNRPASARFWRLRAIENLRRDGTHLPPHVELTDEDQRNSNGTGRGRDTGPLAGVREEVNVMSENEDSGTMADAQVEERDDTDFQFRGTDSSSQSSITHTSSAKFSRRKPMTIVEVAAVLECTDRHVRNLRSKGLLLPDEDDKNLITAGSVKTYIESRKKAKVS